jgi:DNA-binding NarL/FixJ family response regulator
MINLKEIASVEKGVMSFSMHVLVAEDRPIVAEGLRIALAGAADIELVAMVTTRTAEIEARRLEPDVIVADPAHGVLAQRYPWNPRLVALTAVEDAHYMYSQFQNGVVGYVCLRSPLADIAQAIRTVVAGEMFADSIMAAKSIGSIQGRRGEGGLSSRELSVIKLVARGLTDKEIAHNLGVGIKSIGSYKQRAIAKLGVRNRADIVQLAIGRNWLV